ncbi:D-alanyl-D-alanine carboxypeptidase/D-alanyl-D-alanine-endopeptidase [Candidatus Fermentibacteria bacterium]|nr:MAG: D-alanyl-D-alanine carboxypeptidase/D-alanyl-D-alanine-endopeptidase [Candidatus Fermentibacteria bacterium]
MSTGGEMFFQLFLPVVVSLQLLPAVPSSWSCGISAVDMVTGSVLISTNAETPFRPASTVKAVTTLTALSTLGPSHVYHTTIQVDTLQNRIFLVGSGAPLLSIEDVTRAAMETAAALPPGTDWSLYLDPTALTGDSHLPGWDAADWNRTYCPPVEPLCIGDNILEIVVSSVSGVIRTFTYPPLPDLRLTEQVTTTNTRTSLVVTGGNWETGEPEMTISGTIQNGDIEVLYKPFAGAPGELARVLQEELEEWGVNCTYTGVQQADTGLYTTAVMYSDPLWIILGSMNKWSRNIVAEQVLRTVANNVTGESGSTRAGCDISGALLDSLVPGAQGWQLADGSGLSRLDLLTPEQLVAVFVSGAGSLEFGPEFLASFPVNGTDGTLSGRMRELPAGAFRGKTGSLNDTCTIAGILTTHSGRTVALAIFLQFPRGQIWRARAWQDEYIQGLYYTM